MDVNYLVILRLDIVQLLKYDSDVQGETRVKLPTVSDRSSDIKIKISKYCGRMID